jgi:hypothetical protein
MAITTLDGVIAGAQWPRRLVKAVTPTLVAGRPASLWSLAGNPGAGGFNATLNGVTLSNSDNGAINFANPASGHSRLSRLQAAATQPGVLMLADRLWHNGGYTITSTAAQNTTFPGLPTGRDANGATLGDGVLAAVEVSAATGAGTPTLTLGYTNAAGTAGRTATNVIPTVASSAIGAFYEIGLQAGDNGIRSVQSLTLSATWTSGTINLVLYRPIAFLEIPAAFVPNALDALTSGFPRIMDNACLFLVFIPSTTTASNINGSVAWTQG